MEKNHICKKCGGIAGWDSYFQSWICTRCGNEEPKPVTNYDRLISKSPEELADWIMSIEPAACPFRYDHGDDCRFTHCEKCWLDWLKEKVSE